MTKDELKQLQTNAVFNPAMKVESHGSYGPGLVYPYPFLDGQTREESLAAALSFSVTGGQGLHTVVLAARQAGNAEDGALAYFIWCGDAYLEGRREAATALSVSSAIPDLNRQKSALIAAIQAVHSSAPRNGGCNFWARWKSGKGACKHVDAVLHHLDLDAACASLEAALREWTASGVLSPALVWLHRLAPSLEPLPA